MYNAVRCEIRAAGMNRGLYPPPPHRAVYGRSVQMRLSSRAADVFETDTQKLIPQ
jgi:hypothetical protein